MDVAWAPDGRMFVIQKDGLLRVLNPGSSTTVPLKDYSARVNGQYDRGLLGIAVDADYETNNFVYLLFTYDIGTAPETAGPMVSQLLRIELSAQNVVSPNEAILLGSETSGVCGDPANDVDCIPSDGRTHSIGTVRADPDGTLWVGSGDGYTENTIFPERAYDEASMAGKILHIDRNGDGLPGHPFCPGETDLDLVCTKVHSKGFRNPFRFTLRPGGGLVVGDVGWTHGEEIDLVPAAGGRSYGWPCLEGSIATPGYVGRPECTPPAEMQTAPDFDYQHVASNSIVGGPTYTGSAYPTAYRNSIFFGDFTGGFIRRLVPNGAGGFSVQPFSTDWGGVALETAPNGDLVSVNPVDFAQSGVGTVTRIVYPPPAPPAPPASAAAPPPAAPASADRRGPRLRLRSVRPRLGRIAGTASDASGVSSVMVSVRRRLHRGGCSWWLRPKRRMSTGKRRCDRPLRMKAMLDRRNPVVRWSIRLHAKLPAGTFRVLVRATDGKGNTSALPRSRASLVHVRKR